MQFKNVLLATGAINTQDTLDGFKLNTTAGTNVGDKWNGVSTSVILPIPPSRTVLVASSGGGSGGGGNTDHARGAFNGADENGKGGGGAAAAAAATAAVVSTFSIPSLESAPFSKVLNVGDVVGVRIGRGAAAIRVFHVDAAVGHAAKLELAGEHAGMELGAVRLVARHADASYAPAGPGIDTHLRWAAVMKVAEVDSDADFRALVLDVLASKVTTSDTVARTPSNPDPSPPVPESKRKSEGSGDGDGGSDGDDDGDGDGDGGSDGGSDGWSEYVSWEVTAHINTEGGSTLLSVGRNLTCSEAGGLRNQSIHTSWSCLTSRMLNGTEIIPPHLTVNGQLAPSLPSHF